MRLSASHDLYCDRCTYDIHEGPRANVFQPNLETTGKFTTAGAVTYDYTYIISSYGMIQYDVL